MKKLRSSTFAKIIAVVLILVTLALTAVSAAVAVAMEGLGAYPNNYDSAKNKVLSSYCTDKSYEAVYNFTNYYTMPDYFYPDSAFCFTVSDADGNVIFDNLEGRASSYQSDPVDFKSTAAFFADSNHTVYVSTEIDGKPVETVTPPVTATDADINTQSQEEIESADAESWDDTARKSFTLTGYVLKNIPANDDLSFYLKCFDTAYSLRYGVFAVGALSLIISILLFAFLMAAAGHRAEGDEIRGGFAEKIPFDIFTAIMVLAEVLVGAFLGEVLSTSGMPWPVRLILGCMAVAVFIIIAILWCMSWATRLKLHTALKGCVCYKLLSWLWRGIKKLFSMLFAVIKGLPLIPKAALITAGVLLVEFIYLVSNAGDGSAMAFGWFIERVVVVTLFLYALLGMKKLLEAGRELAQGNMSYTVDTSKMRGVVKQHGEDMNNIGVGMNKAVAERMKSEHFRTELITNVSHDIRTPLTSIINYVDLLSKDNIDESTEREYIEVLERQSGKLKKLIDDLIEASKASTGNLSVNPEPCEMGVFLSQMAGEYQEKLEKAGLELVSQIPGESITVMADGRHMWRIFDNLLSNACKYSQSGTRVYLALEREESFAVVTLKNISKTQLNVTGDELMERFVRGDSSRNTEGSGLGLSIARSLTQLQKGEMTLAVDGDLFKVTLKFPAV